MRIFKGINNVVPYKNDVPVPELGRQILRERKVYTCSNCKYESNRRYNMERHQERIHWNRKLHACCGMQFYNKGDYYVHCELFHPKMRLYAIISKTKYKITNNSLAIDHHVFNKQISNSCKLELKQQFSEKIRIEDHESTRRFKSKLSFKYMFTYSDFNIEDIPLIYFLTDQRLKSYLKVLPCLKLKNKTRDESKKQKRSVKIAISSKQTIQEELSEVNDYQERFRSCLDRLPNSQLINKNEDTSIKTTFSKQSFETELPKDVVGNYYQMKVPNSTVSSISLKLPTKKLFLHRYRSDVTQEISLREQNNNCNKQVNFAKEDTPLMLKNLPEKYKRFNRANKENVSKFPFNFEEQMKVQLNRDIMVPVVTQSHRNFLGGIDFEKYKIF